MSEQGRSPAPPDAWSKHFPRLVQASGLAAAMYSGMVLQDTALVIAFSGMMATGKGMAQLSKLGQGTRLDDSTSSLY